MHLLTLISALLMTYTPLIITFEALLFAVKYFIEIKKPKKTEIHVVNIARIASAVAFLVIYVLTFYAKVITFMAYLTVGYICAALIAALGILEIVISLRNSKKKVK